MTPTAKGQLLFLSQCLPYPPDSGVTKRTCNIVRQLSQSFDVTLVAFSRRNHQPDDEALREAVDALEAWATVAEPSRLPPEWSLGARLSAHLRSLVTGRPYIYHIYDSPRFRGSLEQALSTSGFDLVHLDSMDLYRWMDRLPDVPMTCTHHSIESDLLRLRAERADRAWASKYMEIQADRIEELERELPPDFDLNVMMSDVDAERLKRLAPGAETVVVPNGVDTAHFRREETTARRAGEVLFLGPTYMFPNRDGIEFFLDEIWHRVLEDYGDARFRLIGKCPEEDRVRFESHSRVEVMGYVDDIRPYVSRASCFVVPLRVGGGTRLKILDAWALESPVVSTSLGCEGLETVDGENILIRDEPEAFAEAVVRVLSDDRLASSLARQGRETVEKVYDWEVIGREIRSAYEELIDGRPAGRGQRAPAPSDASL